jgi:ribose transport system substrate-binding protein
MKHLRVAVCIAVGVLALALAACGDDDDSDSKSSGSSTSASAAAGKEVIYIGALPNQYYTTINCGAEETAREAGVDYSYQVSKEFTASSQTPLVEAAIAKRPDALLISVVDTNAMVQPLQRAAQSGIKVITVANNLNPDRDDFVTGNVVLDNEANGRLMADQLAAALDGKDGKVTLLGYPKGASAIVDGRTKGFEEQIKQYPNLEYIGAKNITGLTPEEGTQQTQGVLAANPDLVGIVSTFDSATLAMVVALKQKGLQKKVVLIGSDANTDDVKHFKAGIQQRLIADKFRDQGRLGMDMAIKAVTDQQFEDTVTTGPVKVESPDDPALAEVQYAEKC